MRHGFARLSSGNLFLRTEDGFRFVAMHGVPSTHIERSRREPQFVLSEHPNWPLAQIVRTNAVVHIADSPLGQAMPSAIRAQLR
jgi:hypothetical protein